MTYYSHDCSGRMVDASGYDDYYSRQDYGRQDDGYSTATYDAETPQARPNTDPYSRGDAYETQYTTAGYQDDAGRPSVEARSDNYERHDYGGAGAGGNEDYYGLQNSSAAEHGYDYDAAGYGGGQYFGEQQGGAEQYRQVHYKIIFSICCHLTAVRHITANIDSTVACSLDVVMK